MSALQDHDVVGLIGDAVINLHGNGQQTDETVRSVERLVRHYDADIAVMPRWGEVSLREGPGAAGRPIALLDVTPSNVGMNRVLATSRVIDAAIAERLPSTEVRARLKTVGAMPPSSNHLFALACATGAVALSVTFGVEHLPAVMLMFVSAGAGGYVRRLSSRYGANAFAQAFLAALLAGLIGALGVRLNISSDLRLIAVCPCMVIVPGPHLLNGTLDLLAGRLPLGASRLLFAALILLSISAGLLVGLSVWDVSLPAAPVGRTVALWPVIIAAGVAASCYSVFFSMPLRLLGWPIATAMAVDGVRWLAMSELHVGPAGGAGIAGLVAGTLLVPVARRHRIPFAGIGFASIVSLMPGVFVFRMMGGLTSLQFADHAAAVPILEGVVADGLTALLIVAAMTVCIVIPKHLYDTFWPSAPR
ncbi:threonine/serine exporter ThrE family protein [Sphingomonas albertensis]|uniref:Threonine/serine exporter family protein n=1 Tax=Sphingomonas albertensis TaxID=2762591 RepID=A0ABR7ANB2_9SPHN|nr:threonine/serine exporter family protein [Sphingomonas albertensis]MBC3941941.1 threonine/serine exporter family protein [Sphingomonas albertensis]